MVLYRRSWVPGGIYFFTLTLKNRKSDLLTKHFQLLQNVYHQVQTTLPFKTLAYVVLPDHWHVIWRLPHDDWDYASRWRKIKYSFTNALRESNPEFKAYYPIKGSPWQKRYWEHTITTEKDFNNHINYIHYNPVKHGYVDAVCDWPHSSFHRYVEKGSLPNDWGGVSRYDERIDYGES